MDIYMYCQHQADCGERPFGDRYLEDPWVAYHGTSASAEAAIEANGFQWSDASYSRSEVAELVALFERLHWRGDDPRGRPVLDSFTRGDFRRSATVNGKPVFFAESSCRAILYATADWAGGETVRALRHAFTDLARYVSDPAFRREQIYESWKSLHGSCPIVTPSECTISSPEDATPEKLRGLWRLGVRRGVEPTVQPEECIAETLKSLAPLRARCEALRSSHTHGVVFAVRFVESDLAHLSQYSGGIIAQRSIPGDRILAKALIAPDVEHGFPLTLGHQEDWSRLLQCGNGLVCRLAQRRASKPAHRPDVPDVGAL
jgi:hypothetical protein